MLDALAVLAVQSYPVSAYNIPVNRSITGKNAWFWASRGFLCLRAKSLGRFAKFRQLPNREIIFPKQGSKTLRRVMDCPLCGCEFNWCFRPKYGRSRGRDLPQGCFPNADIGAMFKISSTLIQTNPDWVRYLLTLPTLSSRNGSGIARALRKTEGTKLSLVRVGQPGADLAGPQYVEKPDQMW